MATETTYNVIKVQELRAISSAAGNDEIIINDVDSTPLETKKITVENFAYAIKDYVLPIASAEILGGIRVGQGLTINPANGVLRNDIYYINDLFDVQVTNSKPNQVLTYDGAKWANKEFQGITEVVAGDGLSGGGDNGSVIINVNAGNGLSIENDRVNVNTGIGLTTSLDVVYVDVNNSLTFEGNALSVNPGRAIVLDDFGVSVNYGRGFRLFGPYLEAYLGNGLEFAPGDQISVAAGAGLQFVGGDLSAKLGDGLKFVNDAITADLGSGMEFVNGKIDVVGKGDLTITRGGTALGSFNANQKNNETIDIPKPGDGTVTIKYGGNTLNKFTMDQSNSEVVNIPRPPNPGNGRLRILQNGNAIGSFYANQSGGTDINITVKDGQDGQNGADGRIPTDLYAVGTYTLASDDDDVQSPGGGQVQQLSQIPVGGTFQFLRSSGRPPGVWRLMGTRGWRSTSDDAGLSVGLIVRVS